MHFSCFDRAEISARDAVDVPDVMIDNPTPSVRVVRKEQGGQERPPLPSPLLPSLLPYPLPLPPFPLPSPTLPLNRRGVGAI